MRWCYDKRVLIGLAAVVGVVVLLRPSWTLPVLIAAVALACPLSMIVMMRSNAHCGTDAAPAASSSPEGDELAKLRAEVADLKARQAQRARARKQPD